MPPSLHRFFDLLDLDDELLERLLALARSVQSDPLRDELRGQVLALLFLNPSLRTLASFQAGMAQLGGSSIVISPGQGSWQLETRQGVVMDGAAAEHVREAIPVLEQYADALAVRAFAGGNTLAEDLAEPVLASMSACAKKPMISMESASNHPCQALADYKTLDDHDVPRSGGKFVLSWAWHPSALPLAVPAAAVGMAARRGMDITILRPEGYDLPEEIMARARTAAAHSGGTIRETEDREEAMRGAHVLYAKSWAAPSCYGDRLAEGELRSHLRHWCVDEPWFAPAAPDAIFMHCLPVRRNVVVTDRVLDSTRSRVVSQAGNRLHVQKAVLLEMMAGGRR